MQIRLETVYKSESQVLFRLLQYSLFEESAFDGNEMNEKAEFDYPEFDSYFTDSSRQAFFIRSAEQNTLLGFSMIKAQQGFCSIEEFMILPKYRRKGIGRCAAKRCFERHQGVWSVTPSFNSEQAALFWKDVIKDCSVEILEHDRTITFRNGSEHQSY